MASNDKAFERALNTALGLLARRGHTSRELEDKLGRRGFEPKTVSAVVLECERWKYIDDRETGGAYLRELVKKGCGPLAIRCSMRKKGLEESLIDDLFEESDVEERERELCRTVLEKKLKTVSGKKDPKKTKARVYRFLMSRGFSGAVVRDLLEDCSFED